MTENVKVGIDCPPACTFHPDKIGWDIANKLAAFKGAGHGARTFGVEAEKLLGRSFPTSNISRHLRHYVVIDVEAEELASRPKPGDVEILDSIIGAGFRNSKNWKPTIRDTLEAMRLKASMTGNSAFDNLIALFDVDDDDEDDDAERSTDADGFSVEDPAATDEPRDGTE